MVKAAVPQYSGGGGTSSKVLSIDLLQLNGGLNLGVSPVQLGPSESPDAMNVDFPGFGGVTRRRAIASVPTPAAAPGGVTGGGVTLDAAYATDPLATTKGVFNGLFAYERASAGVQVLYGLKSGANTLLFELTSATVKDTINTATVQAATLDSKLYIAAGLATNARRWDGSTSTGLPETYADDPTALPHGAFPRCVCVAAHKGSLFAANLTGDPSGIRWSWPGFPEDWPSWAKESIDPGERKDEIVALVPQGERLLIFKRNSVHALYGDGPRDYRLVPLAKNVGAAGSQAVTKSDDGVVYFFDHPNGLFAIGPSGGPERTSFDKVMPGATRSTTYDPSTIAVRWTNRKLYVSLPWAEAEGNSLTFVMDSVSKAWSAYDLGMTHMVQIIPDYAADYTVAAVQMPNEAACRLGVMDSIGDYDFTVAPILARWQSAWFSGGDLMQDKRWRKVGLVLDASTDIRVSGRLDYGTENKSTHILVAPASSSPKWGTMLWGQFTWTSEDASNGPHVVRAQQSGVGKALSVVVSNAAAGDWSLSAMQITLIPKRKRD